MAVAPAMKLLLRVRGEVVASPGETLTLAEVCEVAGPEGVAARAGAIPIGVAPERPGGIRLISALDVARRVWAELPQADVALLGATEAVVRVAFPGAAGWWVGAKAFAVGLLLLIGSAMAIMNFHSDVNMPAVHRQVYRLLTGHEAERPLWLQVPYSLGVGLGIALFFKLVREKGHRLEPSPLELEMEDYDQSVLRYIAQRTEGMERARAGATYDRVGHDRSGAPRPR